MIVLNGNKVDLTLAGAALLEQQADLENQGGLVDRID